MQLLLEEGYWHSYMWFHVPGPPTFQQWPENWDWAWGWGWYFWYFFVDVYSNKIIYNWTCKLPPWHIHYVHAVVINCCTKFDHFMTINKMLLQRTSAHLSPYPSLSRTRSALSTGSDLSLDSSYNHLPVCAMDDDFICVKDPTQSTRRVSRESIRRFLSANDISITASEHEMRIENPAHDIPSLQQQLALRYVPEIPPDNIR